jgi:hypothetical protein
MTGRRTGLQMGKESQQSASIFPVLKVKIHYHVPIKKKYAWERAKKNHYAAPFTARDPRSSSFG